MLSPTRLLLVALLALVPADVAWGAQLDHNPCLSPLAERKLRCPDLEMSPPFNMFVSRTKSGRVRLHAGNSINSVGDGPAELRGRRDGKYTMAARQVVYRRDGTKRYLDTGARLGFKAIPGQYRYWKYVHAAKFELWRLDRRGRRIKLARVGPKISYCLRDLQHSRPWLMRSPPRFHYPGCSQDLRRRKVTIGTSVGWSDVYPSTYFENWINVTRLRGCFAFVHIADPKNGIFESDEDDNEGETVVRLPWRGAGRNGCPRKSISPEPEEPETGPDGGAEAP